MNAAGQSGDRLHALLEGALRAWRLQDRATLTEAEDAVTIAMAGGICVRVSPIADRDEPDRWRVEVVRPPLSDGQSPRRRVTSHAGIPGMLRTVRAALDPGHRAARMIVTPGGGSPGAR
ncbi:MAG: hypothetical protein QF893_08665 [Alphaproteobacteria bacterium]|jgi:hypothetical protein|nr:hypothetical protein [Alphaproteobacteria bacterium]